MSRNNTILIKFKEGNFKNNLIFSIEIDCHLKLIEELMIEIKMKVTTSNPISTNKAVSLPKNTETIC